MASFALQNVAGNQHTYADPSDIHHVLMSNKSINVTKQGQVSFDIVRSNYTVNGRIGRKACGDCTAHLPLSARITLSSVRLETDEEKQEYLSKIFFPAVKAALKAIEGGAMSGFVVSMDIGTTEQKGTL